jgi:hypothetical protein
MESKIENPHFVPFTNIKLDTLQHERGFDQQNAWHNHWGTLTSESAKANFLLMLKSRRDHNGDVQAGVAFSSLANKWILEKCLTP